VAKFPEIEPMLKESGLHLDAILAKLFGKLKFPSAQVLDQVEWITKSKRKM